MPLTAPAAAVTFAAVLIIAFAIAAPATDAQGLEARKGQKALKGFSLSPKSFEQKDFARFFDLTKENSNAVLWAGDWSAASLAEKGSPASVVVELAGSYQYVPVIEMGFFDQSNGKLLRPLSDENRQAYKKLAVDFVKKYKPRYFGMGVEVNTLYEKDPKAFDDFAKMYGEIRKEIKKMSPDTKVFTVFQLEKMKGLNGTGLFGGSGGKSNAAAKPQWSLLGRFDSDLAAFTTYPGLVYKDPKDIPDDYYSEIARHTSKPVAFVELGWHTSKSIKGLESSEAEQADFVKRFFKLSASVNKELVIWSFMYDPAKAAEPFATMGMVNGDGTFRKAWKEWLAAK